VNVFLCTSQYPYLYLVGPGNGSPLATHVVVVVVVLVLVVRVLVVVLKLLHFAAGPIIKLRLQISDNIPDFCTVSDF